MSYSVTIDLHGETVYSAQKVLTARLKNISPDVREVCVIFGYHSGTALKDFVMRYKNKKIAKKVLGLNQGLVVFVLKDG